MLIITLSVTNQDMDNRYACLLHICANLPIHKNCITERDKATYLILIPDVRNGVVLQQHNVHYYFYRQWLNFTVQFQSNSSCANVKFYQLLYNRVVVTYRPTSEIVSC